VYVAIYHTESADFFSEGSVKLSTLYGVIILRIEQNYSGRSHPETSSDAVSRIISVKKTFDLVSEIEE
jgi:hypothetical protein